MCYFLPVVILLTSSLVKRVFSLLLVDASVYLINILPVKVAYDFALQKVPMFFFFLKKKAQWIV